MTTTHYQHTLTAITGHPGRLNPEQRAWAARRARAARRQDMLDLAATAGVTLLAAGAVTLAWWAGGWPAAVVAAVFIAGVGLVGGWAAGR